MIEAHSQSNCILDGKSRLAVLRVTLKRMNEAYSRSKCTLDGKSRLAVLRVSQKCYPLWEGDVRRHISPNMVRHETCPSVGEGCPDFIPLEKGVSEDMSLI